MYVYASICNICIYNLIIQRQDKRKRQKFRNTVTLLLIKTKIENNTKLRLIK